MNCIATSVKTALNLDIYEGVGHKEPIHWSEVIAFLLSRGIATVPVDPDYYLAYPGVLEGTNDAGSPHMAPIDEPLATVEQKWYFIPVEINAEYAKRYNERIRPLS